MSSTVTAVKISHEGRPTVIHADSYGMRPMQRRVFEKRHEPYLLIKSPPASGKSRALMYLGLDKTINQGLKKVIVAVPEVSIGASFADTALSKDGFFADWSVKPQWDLCSPGADHGVIAKSKVKTLLAFFESDDTAVVCTHSTLRFAYQEAGASIFNDCVLAIDEFHHSSASEDSKLGELLADILNNDSAHVIAMTGSYFRGDDHAIMRPEHEERFTHISYTYWEQMSAYTYLKTLKINYAFYSALDGNYLQALPRVLDLNKKTIIHIPNRGSADCAGHKDDEVDAILEMIGTIDHIDDATNFFHLNTRDGKRIVVANLVEDDTNFRVKVQSALRDKDIQLTVDVIIALRTATEGFDWPPAEHAITIGYRSSLTQVIQIIGRVTRDYKDKHEATFTNLIAEPNAEDDEVVSAVNQMLKAISVSLAMEQALAPRFRFVPRTPDMLDGHAEEDRDTGDIVIAVNGLKEAISERAKACIEHEMQELIAKICQNTDVLKAMANEDIPAEVVQEVYVERVIREHLPNESDEDIEAVRQQVAAYMAMSAIGNGAPIDDNNTLDGAVSPSFFEQEDDNSNSPAVSANHFVGLVRRFVNINELSVNLIDSINPFGHAYQVLSKGLTSDVLQKVHGVAKTQRINMTEDEAKALYGRIKQFVEENGRPPNFQSENAMERRLGEALEWLKNKKREMQKAQQGG